LADPLDRVALLCVAQARLQPNLNQRRVGRREQVGEPRLGLVDPASLVEHDLWDELLVIDRRGARDPRVQVQLLEALDLLLLLEGPRRIGELLSLRLAHVPTERELVCVGLGLRHRLLGLVEQRDDLRVDRGDGAVEKRPGPVDHLYRVGLHQLAAGTVVPPVGRL
jgi:integrase